MVRGLATGILGAALVFASSCAREPFEPLEPITEEDLRLPAPKERPGQIVDIPLERELDPDRERPPPETPLPTFPWLIEHGVDRPRGDYRILGGEELALRHCKDACRKDEMCVAFTYESRGPASDRHPVMCKLKFRLTEPEPCGRCTTGVKP